MGRTRVRATGLFRPRGGEERWGGRDLHSCPVGTPEWAAALAVSGEPLGTVLAGPVDPAPVPGSARELIALRMALGLMTVAGTESEAIDRIRVLEQLKAACAAAQARETVALDARRRAEEADRGVPAGKQGRGLAGEIGLARSVSPHQGSRHVRMARSLAGDLPHTLDALSRGAISEDKAATVHRETAWLPTRSARRHVDRALADRLPVLGERQLAQEARHHALARDPEAAWDHFDQAVTDRHVTVRPTRNGMAYLTAVLPLAQAAACHQALSDSAGGLVATGEAPGRTQPQVVADTLVERLTGQAAAGDTTVEVQLVMTDAALLRGGHDPAWLPGHGPLPARTAHRILADTDADVFVRRLYTAPDTGQLASMDSRRRTFPARLRRMVILRDHLCRTPYCDAQIKHLDHATPHADGGVSSWANASGLCARCNYAKENPGWSHAATGGHLEVTTPTGHHYQHPTPPLVRAGPTPSPGRRSIRGFAPLHLSRRQLTALLDAA